MPLLSQALVRFGDGQFYAEIGVGTPPQQVAVSAAVGQVATVAGQVAGAAGSSSAVLPNAATAAAAKGLPMSVLLEVIQQHPNLKSRIQEIVSRNDYTEPQKMAAIQRIVREKSPGQVAKAVAAGAPAAVASQRG